MIISSQRLTHLRAYCGLLISDYILNSNRVSSHPLDKRHLLKVTPSVFSSLDQMHISYRASFALCSSPQWQWLCVLTVVGLLGNWLPRRWPREFCLAKRSGSRLLILWQLPYFPNHHSSFRSSHASWKGSDTFRNSLREGGNWGRAAWVRALCWELTRT